MQIEKRIKIAGFNFIHFTSVRQKIKNAWAHPKTYVPLPGVVKGILKANARSHAKSPYHVDAAKWATVRLYLNVIKRNEEVMKGK